jgi:hypothetical protein
MAASADRYAAFTGHWLSSCWDNKECVERTCIGGSSLGRLLLSRTNNELRYMSVQKNELKLGTHCFSARRSVSINMSAKVNFDHIALC